MKVVAVGLRGIPGVQGGIETHAEHLYPLLVKAGHAVTVLARAPYAKKANFHGVEVVPLWSPKRSGVEAMVHTGLAVLWAAWHRADVLHVHAVGPGIWIGLARLLGLRVLFTHHGHDYRREKWGAGARFVLRWGEAMAVRRANAVVAISSEIQRNVREMYGVDCRLIPNGVAPVQTVPPDHPVLSQLGLKSQEYIVTLGRLVPEKRQSDLIEAFDLFRKQPQHASYKLVMVGAGDEVSPYVAELRRKAAAVPGAVMAGFRRGDELAALMSNASAFCLPSSHEGLPIALLEALSFGLPAVASNIEANLEVGLSPDAYFELGDVDALASALAAAVRGEQRHPSRRAERRLFVADRYSWPNVAKATSDVLASIQAGHSTHHKPDHVAETD